MNNAHLTDFNPRVRLPMISAEEIEAKFDAGEDISGYMDWDNAVVVQPGEMSPGMKLSLEIEAEAVRRTQLNGPAQTPISPEELDAKFDAGEDVLEHFDVANAQIIDLNPQPLELALPEWVVADLNREAARIGVSRDALLKVWIVERLDEQRTVAASR